jgi:hypothetical protein
LGSYKFHGKIINIQSAGGVVRCVDPERLKGTFTSVDFRFKLGGLPFVGGRQGREFTLKLQLLPSFGLFVDFQRGKKQGVVGNSRKPVKKTDADPLAFPGRACGNGYPRRMENFVALGRFVVRNLDGLGSKMGIVGIQGDGERFFPARGGLIGAAVARAPIGKEWGDGFEIAFAQDHITACRGRTHGRAEQANYTANKGNFGELG